MDIEESLRDFAHRSGMSLKKLSDRTGIGYASMHGFVTGTRSMTMRNAAKLATLFGLELRPIGRRKRKA